MWVDYIGVKLLLLIAIVAKHLMHEVVIKADAFSLGILVPSKFGVKQLKINTCTLRLSFDTLHCCIIQFLAVGRKTIGRRGSDAGFSNLQGIGNFFTLIYVDDLVCCGLNRKTHKRYFFLGRSCNIDLKIISLPAKGS